MIICNIGLKHIVGALKSTVVTQKWGSLLPEVTVSCCSQTAGAREVNFEIASQQQSARGSVALCSFEWVPVYSTILWVPVSRSRPRRERCRNLPWNPQTRGKQRYGLFSYTLLVQIPTSGVKMIQVWIILSGKQQQNFIFQLAKFV